MPSLVEDFTAGFTRGLITGLAANRDVLVPLVEDLVQAAGAGWRKAFEATATDAKAPPETKDVLSEITAEMAAAPLPDP